MTCRSPYVLHVENRIKRKNMSLDHTDIIDAFGIVDQAGFAVLTIADYWDWTDPQAHLIALKTKFKNYIHFVESGQIFETNPNALGMQIVIDFIGRYPVPAEALQIFEQEGEAFRKLNIEFRMKHFPGK